MMLTTSVTATSRMLPVLADTAMTGTNVSPLLPVLPQACKYKIRAAISLNAQAAYSTPALIPDYAECRNK